MTFKPSGVWPTTETQMSKDSFSHVSVHRFSTKRAPTMCGARLFHLVTVSSDPKDE